MPCCCCGQMTKNAFNTNSEAYKKSCKKQALVIVDPQNDFVNPKGSMYIPGAENVIDNICKYIRKNASKIGKIIVTLDSHPLLHISNPLVWKSNPAVGTAIDINAEECSDIVNKWVIKDYDYLNEKRMIDIWPAHCIENSWGWEIADKLKKAIWKWQSKDPMSRYVSYERKGQQPAVEEYGAFSGLIRYTLDDLRHCSGINSGANDIDVVPMIDYRDARFNLELYGLDNYKNILLCGFAKDYCVAYTYRNLMLATQSINRKIVACDYDTTNKKDDVRSLTLLDDCTASIGNNTDNLKLYKQDYYDKAIEEANKLRQKARW